MIVFDEKKYVEENFINHANSIVENRATFELVMIGRYYRYMGYSTNQIIPILQNHLRRSMLKHRMHDAVFINRLIDKIHQRKLYHDRSISITERELDQIKKIGNAPCERTMFVLLVLKKFFGGRYVKVTATEIQRLASINYNLDYFKRKILHRLIEIGYIETYAANIFKVNIGDNNSPVTIVIDDFDDLMKYYLPTCNTKEYFYCPVCWRKTKRKSNSQKYCSRCAKRVKHEKIG